MSLRKGILHGGTFAIIFWAVAILVLLWKGWLLAVMAAFGALCLVIVTAIVATAIYDWKLGALKNTNQPDSGSSVDRDAVRPDDADSGSRQ